MAKMHLKTVYRDDVELIAKIKAMGTWEEDVFLYDNHNSFEIWTWNGKAWKIYKDSEA